MTKTSELSLAVHELRNCAQSLLGVADALAGLSVGDVEAQPKEKAQKKSAQTETPVQQKITLEQVRAVLAEKSRAGFTEQVRSLLVAHGAEKLSGVNPEEYAALLEEAEGLSDG